MEQSTSCVCSRDPGLALSLRFSMRDGVAIVMSNIRGEQEAGMGRISSQISSSLHDVMLWLQMETAGGCKRALEDITPVRDLNHVLRRGGTS